MDNMCLLESYDSALVRYESLSKFEISTAFLAECAYNDVVLENQLEYLNEAETKDKKSFGEKVKAIFKAIKNALSVFFGKLFGFLKKHREKATETVEKEFKDVNVNKDNVNNEELVEPIEFIDYFGFITVDSLGINMFLSEANYTIDKYIRSLSSYINIQTGRPIIESDNICRFIKNSLSLGDVDVPRDINSTDELLNFIRNIPNNVNLFGKKKFRTKKVLLKSLDTDKDLAQKAISKESALEKVAKLEFSNMMKKVDTIEKEFYKNIKDFKNSNEVMESITDLRKHITLSTNIISTLFTANSRVLDKGILQYIKLFKLVGVPDDEIRA